MFASSKHLRYINKRLSDNQALLLSKKYSDQYSYYYYIRDPSLRDIYITYFIPRAILKIHSSQKKYMLFWGQNSHFWTISQNWVDEYKINGIAYVYHTVHQYVFWWCIPELGYFKYVTILHNRSNFFRKQNINNYQNGWRSYDLIYEILKCPNFNPHYMDHTL